MVLVISGMRSALVGVLVHTLPRFTFSSFRDEPAFYDAGTDLLSTFSATVRMASMAKKYTTVCVKTLNMLVSTKDPGTRSASNRAGILRRTPGKTTKAAAAEVAISSRVALGHAILKTTASTAVCTAEEM